MGKIGKIIAGVTGTVLVAGAGIGIGCAVNKDFKNKVDNVKNKVVEFFKRETKQDLKKQVSELLEEIENLKFEKERIIEDYTLQVETLITYKTELINETETLKNHLEEKQARIEELESQGLIDSEELQRLNTEITAINNRIEELESRVAFLENQEVVLRNNISQLEKSLVDLSVQVDNLWNIFENYQIYVESTENGDSSKIELTEEEKQIIEDRIEELESEVVEKTTQAEELENQKIVINNQINNLKEEKIVYETNINNYNEQIIINNNLMIDLSTQNNNYQKTIDSNNEIIANLEALGDKISESEQKQLDDLRLNNATLQEQINNNNITISNTQKTNNEYQALIDTANIELDSLEARIDILETEYSALELQILAVNNDLSNLEKQIDKFGKFLNKVNNDKENEENPPEEGDLTLNIQGESVLNLPFQNMQSVEVIKNYLDSNENYYYEEVKSDDDFSGIFTIFKNATHIFLVSDKTSETVQSMIIVYPDEETAKGVFDSYSNNMENILSENTKLNCVSQCGVIGNIEITVLICEHKETYNEQIIISETDEQIIYQIVTRCSKCDNEISRQTVTENKEVHQHKAGEEIVRENYTETDTEIIYDNVQYCTECGEEISRQTITEKKEVESDYKEGDLVEFTINGFMAGLKYEYGMTWQDWLNSEYWYGERLIVLNNYVLGQNKTSVIINTNSGDAVFANSIISPKATYEMQYYLNDNVAEAIGLVQFSIQNSYDYAYAEKDMTFAEWLESSYCPTNDYIVYKDKIISILNNSFITSNGKTNIANEVISSKNTYVLQDMYEDNCSQVEMKAFRYGDFIKYTFEEMTFEEHISLFRTGLEEKDGYVYYSYDNKYLTLNGEKVLISEVINTEINYSLSEN